MRHSVASKSDFRPWRETSFQPIGQPISYNEFARDVRTGLTKAGQKELYSKYLYDSGGETIWTKSSYKFRCGDVRALANVSGFDCEAQWIDQEWPSAQSVLKAAAC
jgi:uncharacterized SAM-dependent methyltransferase